MLKYSMYDMVLGKYGDQNIQIEADCVAITKRDRFSSLMASGGT